MKKRFYVEINGERIWTENTRSMVKSLVNFKLLDFMDSEEENIEIEVGRE